jgi:hypothetical protein
MDMKKNKDFLQHSLDMEVRVYYDLSKVCDSNLFVYLEGISLVQTFFTGFIFSHYKLREEFGQLPYMGFLEETLLLDKDMGGKRIREIIDTKKEAYIFNVRDKNYDLSGRLFLPEAYDDENLNFRVLRIPYFLVQKHLVNFNVENQ